MLFLMWCRALHPNDADIIHQFQVNSLPHRMNSENMRKTFFFPTWSFYQSTVFDFGNKFLFFLVKFERWFAAQTATTALDGWITYPAKLVRVCCFIGFIVIPYLLSVRLCNHSKPVQDAKNQNSHKNHLCDSTETFQLWNRIFFF